MGKYLSLQLGLMKVSTPFLTSRRPNSRTLSGRHLRPIRVMMVFMGILVCSLAGERSGAQDAIPPAPPESRVTAKQDTVGQMQSGPVYLDRVIDAAEYLVGPGDGLRISVVGEAPAAFDVKITPEATVILPNVGVESVRGLTLAQVRDSLTKVLRGLYPRSTVAVSLVDVRRFRVTVSGAVNDPGLHVVTANTRVSEVLEQAVMSERSSSRAIRLERSGVTQLVDLVAFARLGRREANPYMAEGDVITVPERDPRWQTVEVTGAVNGPGVFEFVAGEKISDLLDLAYGLTPDADTNALELWRFAPGQNAATRFAWPAGSDFSDWCETPLLPDDRLIVRGIDSYRRKLAVHLVGEVKKPGTYIFPRTGISLHEVIDSAGGFTDEADLEHASILRSRTPDWLTEYEKRISQLPVDLRSQSETDWISASALSAPGRVATDFVSLFQRGAREYDVLLSDGDRVIVPRRVLYVNVLGRVVQPGLVPYERGGDMAHYLERVGGYAWRADRGGTFLIKAGSGTALKKNQIRAIEPGDMIVVPTQRGKRFWNSVKETLIVASNVATIYLVIHQATR